MKLAAEDAKNAVMRTISPLSFAVLLGLGVSPGLGAATFVAAEEPANGPTGFSAATESANSAGKTGEAADGPIKKTVAGRPSASKTIRRWPSLRAANNRPAEKPSHRP